MKWVTKKEICIPPIVYNKLREAKDNPLPSILIPKETTNSMDLEEKWNIDEITQRDLPMLPFAIKKILCKYDCRMIPLHQNQLATWQEMEFLESFWGVECGSPESPESPSDRGVQNETEVMTTPERKRESSPKPPPMKKAKKLGGQKLVRQRQLNVSF